MAASVTTALALWPAAARPQDAPAQDRRGQSTSAQDANVEDARRARLDGVWRLDQSDAEARRVVDVAVREAANAMSYFVRGFARSRLRDGTPIHREVELEFEENDRVTVRFGAESHTTTLGRTETVRNPQGEVMRLTQRLRPNGQLEQLFATDQGSRRYVYTPLRDGRLRIATTTDSPRMPQPMYFMLDYRRASEPPAQAARD